MASRIGCTTRLIAEGTGRFTRFAMHALGGVVLRPRRWLNWRVMAPLLMEVGVMSVPVVAITGIFIGMILAVESFAQFAVFGLEDRLGMIINVSVVKQIGPVLAAVMVAGRVGGALTAELGTMRVTEQLDAIRAMGADPIEVLVVPRVVACTLMTPILTIFSDVLGVTGGWLFTVVVNGADHVAYWNLHDQDQNTATQKLQVGVCSFRAAGVGRATTESFVASFLAIIAINLVLADFLREVGRVLLGIGFKSPLG